MIVLEDFLFEFVLTDLMFWLLCENETTKPTKRYFRYLILF